jgi:hypothetical protein
VPVPQQLSQIAILPSRHSDLRKISFQHESQNQLRILAIRLACVHGGLKMDQAKRLKELEKENGKLKRLVAELALDKQILKDIAEGNF